MMAAKRKEGQIVTFYSYKGGVGRTMALANLSFIAAYNQKRVLIMDWDLEAPGLAYYFRGLLDASAAKDLKEAPGLLDVFWDWSNVIGAAKNEKALEATIDRFSKGEPFADLVRPIIDVDLIPSITTLHYIGAGGKVINSPDPRPYEEALASFSWSDFFDKYAGGFVLESFKKWAKSNYDLILIDSRTGLADVSGICTMQIPDVVALCFILNRQNIDGVAKVASALRIKRSEEITIRAVPMRVARREVSEESDARARAISELTRIGGFSNAGVVDDIRNLSVYAEENVPFYETLAPFNTSDPSLDPLTLNYIKLASQLVGEDFKTPIFTSEFVELVRRRLQPRQATIEYISKLKNMESGRAITELQNYLDSAFDTEFDGGELKPEYVKAIIEAVREIGEATSDPFQASTMRSKALDLLRTLKVAEPQKWKSLLLGELQSYLDDYTFFVESEEEVSILEELDSLLAEEVTHSTQLKRIYFRRKALRNFISKKDVEASMQTVGEISALLGRLSKDSDSLATDQMRELFEADVDLNLARGDICIARADFEGAYKEFDSGLGRVSEIQPDELSDELSRLCFNLHSRMTDLPVFLVDKEEAAVHAVLASLVSKSVYPVVSRFSHFAKTIANANEVRRTKLTRDFAQIIFNSEITKLQLVSSYGRSPTVASDYLTATTGLLKALPSSKQPEAVVISIADATDQLLRSLLRRRQTIGAKQVSLLMHPLREALDEFERCGLDTFSYSNLTISRTYFLRANERIIPGRSEE